MMSSQFNPSKSIIGSLLNSLVLNVFMLLKIKNFVLELERERSPKAIEKYPVNVITQGPLTLT